MLAEHSQLSIRQFLIIVTQLVLLTLVIRQFQIESSAFLRISFLAFGGFAVHAILPLQYRLPFFVLLSFAGIGVVLGTVTAIWLVSIGFLLIGVCHLPLSYAYRVGLLILIGGLLALLRIDWFQAPWSQAIWPVLASMFMFRLMVYLYDLEHDKTPMSISRTLAYFFLLPNICFPLFPVVDYKTFRRTYYDDDPHLIYQRGVQWMTRGIIHLILYRFIYYYLTLAPAEVTSPGELGQYLLTTFLLYLRISGLFHLIVGMLHLFGFHLPETHHRYYLASSFTDFWRRINIYWKDFMLKLFYYPIYFKLRHWGNTVALVGATLAVFVLTWFLHAYQWFWLRGSFLLTGPDVLFWSILAALVVINSLYEAAYPKAKTLSKTSWTFRASVGSALRTMGTFIVICLLWSLWTSESIAAWWSLMTSVRGVTGLDVTLGISLLLVATTVRGVTHSDENTLQQNGDSGSQRKLGAGKLPAAHLKERAFYTSVWQTASSLLVLSLLGLPIVYSQLGTNIATGIHSLRSGKLSRVDTARLERGYYEDLLGVDRFNSQLWEVYMNRPLRWLDAEGIGLERFTDNFLQKELVPSFTSLNSGVLVSTNRWGMRDRDYEQLPAPHTYRVALLGASSVMGWGIEDDKTFEALLEYRLNQEATGELYARYEILNFAVAGYEPLQQRMVLEKALTFQPQAVFYVATGREAELAAHYLAQVIRKNVNIPYEYLKELAQRAGLETDMEETVALRRLEPFQKELLSWLYREIVQECRARNVLPVWIFLPQVYAGSWQVGVAEVRQLAEEVGFTVIDLSNVYEGYDLLALRVAEWDNHPNVKAHQLIADRLYEELREKTQVGLFPLFTHKERLVTTTGAN